MQWPLADSVAATHVGSDMVFLDLQHDRYSCLRHQPGLYLQGRQVAARSPEAIQPLITAGFLGAKPSDGECDDRLPPVRPARDLDAPPAVAVHLAEVLDFLLCWAETLARFPGRSILALHNQVRRPSEPCLATDIERIRRRVSAFEALLPWTPFPGACLFRSYLLLRFLQRGGCDARWVIGVRTWPFEAHCWLQSDDIVLNDRCERLVRFQPLLAI